MNNKIKIMFVFLFLVGSRFIVSADTEIKPVIQGVTMRDVSSDSLSGSFTNGEAYVCVYDNGTIFAKDSACS